MDGVETALLCASAAISTAISRTYSGRARITGCAVPCTAIGTALVLTLRVLLADGAEHRERSAWALGCVYWTLEAMRRAVAADQCLARDSDRALRVAW